MKKFTMIREQKVIKNKMLKEFEKSKEKQRKE
jgi:hypothetical protein